MILTAETHSIANFQQDFDHSITPERRAADRAAIEKAFPFVTDIRNGSDSEDRQGTDYIATMEGAATARVDAKTRKQGCSHFWKEENGQKVPDLALELWSVMPGGKYNTPTNRARIGWTLDARKKTDFALFTYHPSDSVLVYVFPFSTLRSAFAANKDAWISRYGYNGKPSTQKTVDRQHESQCIFVPAPVVMQVVPGSYFVRT